MKGLFSYWYDYYEMEYLICVSEDESKLIEKYNEFSNDDHYELVICERRHSELASKEVDHSMIKDVEVL